MQFKQWLIKCDLLVLNIIIYLFKLSGISPFTVSIYSSSKFNRKNISLKLSYSMIGSVYNFFLAFGSIIALIHGACNINDPALGNESKLQYMFINIYGIIAYFLMAIILIMYSITQRKLVVNINKLLKLNGVIKKKLENSYEFKFKKFLVITFILYYSIFIFNSIFVRWFRYNTRIILLLIQFAIANVIIQYAIIFTYVQQIYHSINNYLLKSSLFQQELESNLPISLIKKSDDINIDGQKIIFCRKIQSTLSQISHEISEFYSWPILFCIFLSCATLIYTTYRLVMVIFLEKYTFTILSVDWLLRSIQIIFHLIILTSSINDLSCEIKRTSDIVYQLMSIYTEKSKIMFELEQFSMELLHRKQTEFTACGLFSLDRSLLATGSRVMFTYMILLIQSQFDNDLFETDNLNNLINNNNVTAANSSSEIP